jgi:hypothetical protein
MSSVRRFHSIAALCGDGLRPELQALFERLAVNPHTELFTRNDGMLQSGPDRVAVADSRRRAIGDSGRASGDSAKDVVFSRKLQSSN